jgi:hypothetical protein
MQTVAIPQIIERLQKLPVEKLAVVYDFVSLLNRKRKGRRTNRTSFGRFSDDASI